MASSIVAGVDHTGPDAATDASPVRVEISEDAARGVHRDAIALKRAEFLQSAGFSALSIAGAVTAILLGALRGKATAFPILLLVFAARFIVGTVTLGLEWRRLVRETPIGSLEREKREDAEVLAHRSRMRQLGPRSWSVYLPLLVVVVTVVEFVMMSARGERTVLTAAALVKPAVRAGEWWRLLSAAYLHANALHLTGNMTAMLAFGGLVEAYDDRRRLPLVFVLAAIAGNVASTLMLSATSLGASGGILGLAGYALVIALRRSSGASGWLFGQLLRLVGVVLVTGIVGFFFIDNAGHIGGLLAGIALGLFAVPRAGGSIPPSRTRFLNVSGAIAAGVFVIAAVGTLVRLLTI
jgi:membrane associated rhomboid family serine protease